MTMVTSPDDMGETYCFDAVELERFSIVYRVSCDHIGHCKIARYEKAGGHGISTTRAYGQQKTDQQTREGNGKEKESENSHSRSLGLRIFPNGISPNRAQLHSTTARPCSRRIGPSAGDRVCVAFGLVYESITGTACLGTFFNCTFFERRESHSR